MQSYDGANFDDNDSGYYLALVNQFNDHLSLGYRYGKLVPADVPTGLVGSALDSGNNDPETHSIMSEWKFDSSSIMRLQLNHETPRADIIDGQGRSKQHLGNPFKNGKLSTKRK